MKIHIANYQPWRVGGGWTFARNFADGLSGQATSFNEADIYFVTSPSMVQRSDVEQAKIAGKKIVLRIDNAVRNSRNRNTGMSRMKDFYAWADLVVFQSHWAKGYLSPYLGDKKHTAVILNGVNLNDYYAGQANRADNILYSRFNRDETKNWEVARYWFSQYQLKHKSAKLHIVGNFSDELRAGNFDFYNGENYGFYGVADSKTLAKLYSVSSLLYSYYNDACSNTLIEALCSGCPVVGDQYYRDTGGSPEIISQFTEYGRDYFSHKRMADQYLEEMGKL